MKFAVCALVKNENLYLREWVEHYIRIGFDKIYLLDNNDKYGENPEIVIQDYIDQGFVEVDETYRGVEQIFSYQGKIYNECLDKWGKDYDWMLICDVDEFLHLFDCKNVQEIFEKYPYKDFDEVLVQWYNICGPDLYYKPEPVMKRFTTHNPKGINYPGNIPMDAFVKSFIQTKSNIRFSTGAINNMHIATTENKCNGLGEKIKTTVYFTLQINHQGMCLLHYWSKSFSEFFWRKVRYENSNIPMKDAQEIKNKWISQSGIWSDEHEKLFQNLVERVVEK